MDTLSAVLDLVTVNEVTEPRAEGIRQLARAYLRRWDEVELEPTSTYHLLADLYGFIEERSTPAKIRVFSPNLAEHGYETVGSVIQLNLDDGPFLFDTIAAELQRRRLSVAVAEHPVVGVERDGDRISSVKSGIESTHRESVQHFELHRHLDEAEAKDLLAAISEVVGDAQQVAADHEAMRRRVDRMMSFAHQAGQRYDQDDIEETVAFLKWLRDGHFIFLGYREYALVDTDKGRAVVTVAESGLGVLADPTHSKVASPVPLSSLRPALASRYVDGPLLTITKTNRHSTVQRDVEDGLRRAPAPRFAEGTYDWARLAFLGLFSTKAAAAESGPRYPHPPHESSPPSSTPKTSSKVRATHKAAIQMFDGFSKHDLFASPTEDLRERSGRTSPNGQERWRTALCTTRPTRTFGLYSPITTSRVVQCTGCGGSSRSTSSNGLRESPLTIT